MNPDHAIAIHLEWKLSLRQALRTGVASNLDPEVLGRTDRCELGLWLNDPQTLRAGGAELRDLHARFHRVARELLLLMQQQATRQRMAQVEQDLEDLSASLVRAIGQTSRGTTP